MRPVLVITRDPALGVEARALLEILGRSARVEEALPAEPGAFDAALVDVDEGCRVGRQAVAWAQAVPNRPAVLWTGPCLARAPGPVFRELPDAWLPTPLALGPLGSALRQLERARPASEPLDLARVDGPLELAPPVRVLWSAWTRKATGRLELFHDGVEIELYLRGGRIVEARGIEVIDGAGTSSRWSEGLTAGVGRRMAAGEPADQLLDAVALGVGRAVAATVGCLGGMVLFEPDVEPEDEGFPLPRELPWILAAALKERRGAELLRRVYAPHQADLLVPAGAELEGFPLPAAALRLCRAAARRPPLAEVLGAEDAALQGLDLVLHLGLLALDRPPPPAAPPEMPPPVGKARASAAAPPTRSKEVEELLAERSRLRELDAPGVLGISRAEELEPRSLDERFRLISAKFHPDRYTRQGEEAQRIARDCFALVGEAYALLKQPDVLYEARMRLQARAEGRVWTSETDKRRAQLLLTEAQFAFSEGRIVPARASIERAWEIWPEDWRIRLLRLRLLRQAREIDALKLVEELQAMEVPEGRARADLLYLRGEALLEADREAAAYQAFEEAVAQFPDHIEARRRLRLRARRLQGEEGLRKLDQDHRKKSEEGAASAGAAGRKGGETEQPRKGDIKDRLGELFKRS